MDAKALYTNWMDPKDERPAFSFRQAILRREKPDGRALFYKACQSSEAGLVWKLNILVARSSRKHCNDLHAAHSSFTDHLSGETDVRHMTTGSTALEL